LKVKTLINHLSTDSNATIFIQSLKTNDFLEFNPKAIHEEIRDYLLEMTTQNFEVVDNVLTIYI
jgi:hypothetical protein